MKKFLSIVLAVILCLSLFSGCNTQILDESGESSSETEEFREAIPDLNMATLISLVEINGEDLSWINLAPYYYSEKENGLYIREYNIDAEYYLLIGGESTLVDPEYIILVSKNDPERKIDVRYESIEDFLNGKNKDTDASVGLDFKVESLMTGIVPNSVKVSDKMREGSITATDFAISLFKAINDSEKNTLISPISVLYALGMVANGAKGETKSQLEETIGMSIDDLNIYLYSYMKMLPQSEKYKLNISNSIWINNDHQFWVNRSFLQNNADYYGADVFNAPFDDQTLNAMNDWVNYHTDGLIPKALNELIPNAVMYLINALLFEAEWSTMYGEYSVRDGEFTLESGEKKPVELMYSEEYKYLENELSTGFIKNYNDGKYAFAAILPNEGVTIDEFISSLDGENVNMLLAGAKNTTVDAVMPKFKTEYEIEMSEILKNIGIVDAFDFVSADFTGLGTSGGNIYISKVMHKTYIEVGEVGTKAGAVTVEIIEEESIPLEPPKRVVLDRPFVYMIFDCENNIPIFIGTMMGE